MRFLEDLKEKCLEDLEKRSKKDSMSSSEYEMVHLLTDTVKNIDKIIMFEFAEDGGYSRDDGRDYSNRGRNGYSRDGDGGSSYNDGNSYARRGEHYVQGHYSRESRYSREDGKGNMSDQLRSMMENAHNEKEREALRRCLSQIENI